MHIWKILRTFVIDKDNPLILTIMNINDVIWKVEYVLSTVRGLHDEPQNVGPEDLLETLKDLDEVRRYLKDYSEQYLLRDYIDED